MRARLVVFPIEGRKWCFARSFDRIPSDSQSSSSSPPPTLNGLWNKLTSEGRSMQDSAELAVDFISDKMNRGWINLEKAPAGTFKNRIYSLGLKLLSRVKPSEIFLKSVSKDIVKVDIIFPASLNPRLVRRRLRHIAMRGCINHKTYFYGSVILLPFTMAFTILPLPNIPFFWILFRAYSHWGALKGSERLMLLVSDCSKAWDSLIASGDKIETTGYDSAHTEDYALQAPWPSQELESLLTGEDTQDGANCSRISSVCEAYHLSEKDVLKFKDSQ